MYFENKRFIEANIELTNLCNFNCWFCPRKAMSRDKGQMTYKQFEALVMNLNSANFLKEIALAGIGEPTLHPDIIKMISFVKNFTTFKVVLTTNASKFVDRSFAEALLKTNVDKVTISLRTSEENGAILSSDFTYGEYIESILNFIQTKYKFNYKAEIELSFFKETYYSKYILDINTSDFINNETLNKFFKELSKILNEDLPSYDDFTKGISSHLSNVARISLREGLNLRFDGLSSWTTAMEKNGGRCHKAYYGSCLGLLTHFAIYWNGDVSTCCADFDARNILGNIFEQNDIIKILSSKKAITIAGSLRKKIMPTQTCQICRGGKSLKEKWANILGTICYVK